MLEILVLLVIAAGLVLLVYGLFIQEKDLIVAGLIIGLAPLLVYMVWKADIQVTAWKFRQIKDLI